MTLTAYDSQQTWSALVSAAENDPEAIAAVRAAISRMLLHGSSTGVFFATLAMELQIRSSLAVGTAATDGTYLVVSPPWFLGLNKFQQAGVVAHEVMHLAMLHHLRRAWRSLNEWNAACDLASNNILVASGFALPDEGLFPGKNAFKKFPRMLSAEDYYALLTTADTGGNAITVTEAAAISCGAVVDAADVAADVRAATTTWRARLVKARNAAEAREPLSAALRQIIDKQVNPQVDYRQVLRQFVSLAASDNYCWGRPNRRYVSSGIHLPSMRSESLGYVVLVVDTSASVFDPITLSHFSAECASAMSAYSCKAKIVYCDDTVRAVDDWEPSHGPFVLRPLGGGNTSHVPVWDWLAKNDVRPACVICLTDGMTTFGKQPDVPVLWVMTTDAVPPFGQTVRIETD